MKCIIPAYDIFVLVVSQCVFGVSGVIFGVFCNLSAIWGILHVPGVSQNDFRGLSRVWPRMLLTSFCVQRVFWRVSPTPWRVQRV